MSDQPEGNKQVEEQPQEPMPSSDKPTEDQKSNDLPDDSSERTREQFEKLKEANKKLKEQLEQQSRSQPPQPSVLESLRPQQPQNQIPQMDANQFSNLSQNQVNQIQESFTTKGDDGYEYVDSVKLQQALAQANERARRAEQEAQQTRQQFVTYEETQQTREAYAKHPELNPNSDQFDRDFYNEVRDKLIAQAYRGEKDLVKAADQVARYMKRPTPQAEPQTKPQEPSMSEVKETQKQQINATDSAPKGATSWDHSQLRAATMRGEKGAIAERLKRSGF